jgi:ParB family chromosome partitioning protein
MADTGRTRLGKGLSALLGELPPAAEALAADERAVREIPVARCSPNPHQPRGRFDPEETRRLADSIRQRGLLQPILVTPDGAGGYRIVAGERRWRAAREAGLDTVPAVVRQVGPREMLELALIENLQRTDLNAIEEARGYQALVERFGLGHGEIAERVAKDRSTIANALRLLDLPREVQELVETGRLAMGHARALLGLDSAEDQVRLARATAAKGLSVRQVEALVRRARAGEDRPRSRTPRSRHVRSLEDELQRALATRVRIVESKGGGGMIQLSYSSAEEFERLRDLLVRRVE